MNRESAVTFLDSLFTLDDRDQRKELRKRIDEDHIQIRKFKRILLLDSSMKTDQVIKEIFRLYIKDNSKNIIQKLYIKRVMIHFG